MLGILELPKFATILYRSHLASSIQMMHKFARTLKWVDVNRDGNICHCGSISSFHQFCHVEATWKVHLQVVNFLGLTQLSILLGWVKEKYCLRTISVNVLKTGYKWKALYKFCTTCYNSHHKLLLNSIVFVVFFSMFMLSSTSWQGWFLGQISWTEHTLPHSLLSHLQQTINFCTSASVPPTPMRCFILSPNSLIL